LQVVAFDLMHLAHGTELDAMRWAELVGLAAYSYPITGTD
jgi:hypothetical protein